VIGDASTTPRSRRRVGKAMAEMHYQLRTEGDTPTRTAAAVFLGTFIGCLPLYGLHFILCFGLARLLGLNRVKTYLAAHVNNPLTAPFLLGAQFAVGHALLTGSWPAWDPSLFGDTSLTRLGGELLAGSLVLGFAVAVVLGTFALVVSGRWRAAPAWDRLAEETARRYLDAGVSHWEFVRGKLRHDPLYRQTLSPGFLPEDGVLLDLGCGRGIVLSLLLTAAQRQTQGDWDLDDCAPSRNLALEGVDCRSSHAAVAEMATAGRARITIADLATWTLPRAKCILMFDVLHYLSASEQESLVRRAASALEPGGVILIREPDSGRRVRFLLTRFGERMSAVLRGAWDRPFHYRSSESWLALLESQGMTVSTRWSSHGTPFANLLIRCVRHKAKAQEPRG